MYLCICCNITQKDIEEKPELKHYIGSVCGACLNFGPDRGFDVIDERLTDDSLDHDTIK